MSWWLEEYVHEVSPRKTQDIANVAEQALAVLQPEVLLGPRAVDLVALIEGPLEEIGIFFSPDDSDELGGTRLAKTEFGAIGEINVILLQSQWDDLFRGGRRAFQPRATCAHELGHVVLHIPEVRRNMAAFARQAMKKRTELLPFREPEWQAWTFADAFLMPVTTLCTVKHRPVHEISDIYQVSNRFARAALKRLGRLL